MKTYRVEDIICSFGIFLDEEVEAKNMSEAKEIVYNEIMDNLGNYIDIEMEEVVEGEEDD
jgi:hypothetical protein